MHRYLVEEVPLSQQRLWPASNRHFRLGMNTNECLDKIMKLDRSLPQIFYWYVDSNQSFIFMLLRNVLIISKENKKFNSPPKGFAVVIEIISLYVTSPQRHHCQWSIVRFVPIHDFMDLKSNHVLENYSTGSDYSTDKCIWTADEMDMTPLQGSCAGTRSTVYLYTMEQSAWATCVSCSFGIGWEIL